MRLRILVFALASASLGALAAGKLAQTRADGQEVREHLRMAHAAQQGSKAEKPRASEQPGQDTSGSMKR